MSKIQSAVSIGLVSLACLTLAACGGGGGGGSSEGTDAPAPLSATLSHVADCGELHEAVRADAREKIRIQADELRAHGWAYSGGSLPVATAAPQPQATPAPEAGPAPDDTDTNTQVPGVDEADVVETDGEHLYLLRASELLILPVSPPEATALTERIAIEGYPLGMFVADQRALIVSSVPDDGALGGDPQCGTIGAPFPVAPWVDEPGFGSPPVVPCTSLFTKVTLLDLGASPARVAREVYVEGTYVGARRHGTRARVIVQRAWGTPPGIGDPWQTLWAPAPPRDEAELVARVDAWEAQALAAIETSALDDWLPAVRERVDGALVDHPPDCTDVHLAPPGHARQGTTMIVGLDLVSDGAPLTETTLLAGGSQIYANADTLLLASADWQVVAFDDATSRTALHVFALPADSLETPYQGSGFVPGTLLSQFALDVRDDVIRVATGYTRELDGRNVTRVLTARLTDGELARIGTTSDIAPGELLQSARFLGDRAYLVTFLRIDPLFVIDLADPAQPTVLGEVELPGFSEYLHPLDDTHLLTIGRGGDFGALAVRTFDVGDPTAPRIVDTYVLPGEASSPAEGNHLAFTFDRRSGLLALPVNFYAGTALATLELVAVDASAGITRLGSVEHPGTPPAPCLPPYDFEYCPGVMTWMERGLFIGDAVYALSTNELTVHRRDDLAHPLATVSLP